MSTKTPQVKFTGKRWSDLSGSGITRSHVRGWMELHDLAVEAYEAREDLDLPFEAYRELVSAANNGLPIIIRTRDVTRTYVVQQFIGYGRSTSNLYVRSWGFSFSLSLDDIVSVEVPEQVFHSEPNVRGESLAHYLKHHA